MSHTFAEPATSTADGNAYVDSLGVAETRLVSGWVTPTLGDIPVSFGSPPAARLGPRGLTMTLLAPIPVTPARASHQPGSLRMLARYLVSASASTAGEADRCIVDLAFAALEAGAPEIERDGPRTELWLAFNVPARPALLIRTPLERARTSRRPPPVRQVVTRWVHGRPLTGLVLGPDDTPIPGAMIEVEGTGVTSFSDYRGEFRFASVSTGPPAPTLAITAKGVRLSVRVDTAPEELFLIRLPLPES